MDNKQTKEEVQQNLINNLFWKSCIRNDKAVAQTLWEAREIDSIFGLEETGLLDDFFHFLQVFNIWPNIEKLNSSEIKRVMVSITHFVVLYMLKVIYGIKHMDSLRELLFSDQAAMRFVGFNAHQIKYGVCNRGDHKRKNKEKTGPITPETLSDNLVKISIRQMESFFNNCIKCLAKGKIFPKKLRVIIDGTDIETRKDFPGAGRAIRKEEIVDKMGQKKTIEITVYGFKLMALFAVGAKFISGKGAWGSCFKGSSFASLFFTSSSFSAKILRSFTVKPDFSSDMANLLINYPQSINFKPKLNDFLLDLHQSLAHQGLAKSLNISIGMPTLFVSIAASRSRHISSQKIAQLRLKF